MAGTSKPAAKPGTRAKRGSAGTRGPVPKRSSERRRRNTESEVESVVVEGPDVVVPEADEEWHPIALGWYKALADSGQAKFYEPSDWQYARYIAEVMSRNLKQGQKFSAMLFTAVQSGMSDLLTTEGDRRRVRMEIERKPPESEQPPAGVIAIAGYRERLAAAGGKKGG